MTASDSDYQKVFFDYTKTLDNILLSRLCLDNDVNVSCFLSWVAADKVRQAKLQEVTQSRIIAMEKSK